MPSHDPAGTVAESGSPNAPALVLIHGYAAPTAWWNPLVLLLAKTHDGVIDAEPC
ncbi:hypothetical protein ACFQ0X_03565 [Streptomyces rectiviolaceus]|uniref:Alpha/beta hydrolase n=1 Tax=Streptomyces rectiviolaceus TaxID=332591 RepID=A0ABP6MDL1_9ACTN